MLKNMTGQDPSDADIQCVTSKVSTEDFQQMSSQSADTQAATEKVFSALFGCNPKGLAENFAKSTFADTPGVTDSQKSCLGEKLVKTIATNPEIIAGIASDASEPPASFVSGAKAAIESCVPAGATQTALIDSLSKK
jgi:hypothetical protein